MFAATASPLFCRVSATLNTAMDSMRVWSEVLLQMIYATIAKDVCCRRRVFLRGSSMLHVQIVSALPLDSRAFAVFIVTHLFRGGDGEWPCRLHPLPPHHLPLPLPPLQQPHNQVQMQIQQYKRVWPRYSPKSTPRRRPAPRWCNVCSAMAMLPTQPRRHP